MDCSKGRRLDSDSMRFLHAPDSLFLRGLRFRKIARVSSISISSERDLHGMSVTAKLRILMERIDKITSGKVAILDARVICYTICWDMQGFVPRRWWSPQFRHTFWAEKPGLHDVVQQEQDRDHGDERCAEHRRPQEKEADNHH